MEVENTTYNKIHSENWKEKPKAKEGTPKEDESPLPQTGWDMPSYDMGTDAIQPFGFEQTMPLYQSGFQQPWGGLEQQPWGGLEQQAPLEQPMKQQEKPIAAFRFDIR